MTTKIPLRQKLANWMMRRHSPFLGSYTLEKIYANFIFNQIAGPKPWFWVHYGKNCICCKWGWHK